MQSMMDLVHLAQRGDSTAFGALYDAWVGDVTRLVRSRIGGPPELVEDLTAEIFLKLVRHLPRYRGEDVPFQAWLFRIVRNHLIDYGRTNRHYRSCPINEELQLEATWASRDLDQVLDRQILAAALDQLTAVQQQVIQCRFFDGLSVAETAVRLGRSEDAVKKLHARTLAVLQRLLAGQSRSHVSPEPSSSMAS